MNEHYRVLNALQKNLSLDSELPSSSPELYAWIGVYPLDLSRVNTIKRLKSKGVNISDPSQTVYCIRLFEAEKELIDQDVWVCESDLKNKQEFFVQGEEALFSKLSELNIDPDKLGADYNSNCPI